MEAEPLDRVPVRKSLVGNKGMMEEVEQFWAMKEMN
jgi:hypothetical protein